MTTNKHGIRDIGKGKWKGLWVSKSELYHFLKCKYRIFVSHKENIPLSEFIRPGFIDLILEKGAEFESKITAQLPLERKATLEQSLDKKVILRTTEMVRNHELGIYGILDLIDIQKGGLIPIEIKNHRSVIESDQCELAFYWLLLEPLRTRKIKPHGFVLLNTGETVEVTLSKDILNHIEYLIDIIREVKQFGTEPEICPECKRCVLEEQCKQTIIKSEDLTLIYNIAGRRKLYLKSLGIHNFADLIEADPKKLHYDLLNKYNATPGLPEIIAMQNHAKSWVHKKPIYYGQDFQNYAKMIIFDLEYDPMAHIWLSGLYVIGKNKSHFYQFFAENKSQEKNLIMKMLDILKRYDNLPIMTWAGTAADFPALRRAWDKHRLELDILYGLEERHIDLYFLTIDNFRFPLSNFDLKGIAEYLGFKRKHKEIKGGEDALWLYNEYLNLPKSEWKERQKIKDLLLSYNKEDLKATAYINDMLKELANVK